jgi:hypothetical protein
MLPRLRGQGGGEGGGLGAEGYLRGEERYADAVFEAGIGEKAQGGTKKKTTERLHLARRRARSGGD